MFPSFCFSCSFSPFFPYISPSLSFIPQYPAHFLSRFLSILFYYGFLFLYCSPSLSLSLLYLSLSHPTGPPPCRKRPLIQLGPSNQISPRPRGKIGRDYWQMNTDLYRTAQRENDGGRESTSSPFHFFPLLSAPPPLYNHHGLFPQVYGER